MYGFFQMYLEFNNALTDSVLMALDFNGAKGKNVLHVVVDVVDVVVVSVVTGGVDVNGKVVSIKVVICWVVLNVIPSVVLVVLVVDLSIVVRPVPVLSVSSVVSGLVVRGVAGLSVVEVKTSALSLISKEHIKEGGYKLFYFPPFPENILLILISTYINIL